MCNFCLHNSQPIKDVIPNRHDKLNRLVIAHAPAISCQKLLKLVDECGRYSKQNQCYFRYTAWLKRPNFWVYVSAGSAETLARGGGITNHYLIAHSLSNISAKNYQNRLMCVEVIVCYIIVVFFETQCTSWLLLSNQTTLCIFLVSMTEFA